MRQPIQVSVYPVRSTKDGWEYLLLRRTEGRGGFWQGVTGGVEEDEDILEAARRELVEETGIVPSEIQRVDYTYSFPVTDRWRFLYAEGVQEIVEYVFVAHAEGQHDPMIDPREHDTWEWVGLNQALDLLTWPGNIEALKQCAGFLSNRVPSK
jgi:dATP pyrophosphohydrolase